MDNGQLTIHEIIEQNHWKKALELINQAQPDELNAKNELGQTPMHLAVAAKHLGGAFTNERDKIINALIERGANVNAQDQDGETVVHYISRWLLNSSSEPDEKVKPFVPSNNQKDKWLVQALQFLIKGKADVNIEDKNGDTALDHILNSEKSNAYNTIETLLEAGAKIKTSAQALKVIKGSIWYSKDSLAIVKLVIPKYLADINHKDKEGNTALSLAYENKKFDVIKLLIEKGADPKTIIPSTGKSFITHVIEENLFKFVPSLKFDVVLENGLSPLAIAVNSNNYDSVKLLIDKHKADVNFSDGYGRKAIHYAAVGGNTDIVNYLLNHSADVNSLDGNTALHYAAANRDGNRNIALLIQKGIDINCQNKNGIRPIRFAIENNHLTNLQILLNHGASLEMKDFEGIEKIDPSIVVVLLKSKHCSIVQDLLKNKRTNLDEILKVPADPNEGARYTILYWTAINNRIDIFEALKPYIKSKHIEDYKYMIWNIIPLHCALSAGNVDIVKFILNIPNINVNAIEDSCRKTSLIISAKNSDLLFMLIEKGLDTQNPRAQENLLTLAVKFVAENDVHSLNALLSKKIINDIDALNYENNSNYSYKYSTILHAVVENKNIEMIKMFIKHKPDANRNYYGTTLLHHFAREYHEDKAKMKDVMMLLILLFNADLTLKDDKGKIPLDYLKDESFKKYLEEDVVELRNNINETCGTDATAFILHYFEQNPDQSIESCVKDLSKNLKPLMDEYARNTDNPSTSFSTAEVEKRVRIAQLCNKIES